ncbi:hypothetical protein [Candidatus Magnetominusculus xianensis]|uniref:Anti-anti-sigma regulatory factor n=1 Tax=Candidatus Magnetominusculus xianensis TaxID=1748249 RepID=A0ABR5SIP5_9BACT|nr:hypothetical protein [Candidatus Magnetominusculus xianensis]KWT92814.1 anti-anti-sigma regulatory factor [Candidatus Magnetominusculus xianensis]MBF0403403.1 hypothetical protein [Nitrospirota bacterium]
MSVNSKVAITKTQGVIVVTMHPDLDTDDFNAMCEAVLTQIVKSDIKAVILDFSAVDVLNLTEFNRARAFLNSVYLLGAETAIVSLSAGIVVYLTEVQAETQGTNYFFGLDEALQRFGKGESG